MTQKEWHKKSASLEVGDIVEAFLDYPSEKYKRMLLAICEVMPTISPDVPRFMVQELPYGGRYELNFGFGFKKVGRCSQ